MSDKTQTTKESEEVWHDAEGNKIVGVGASSQTTNSSINPAEELADAVWQILDDMRHDGTSVCPAAKARLRIAFEPFIDENADMTDIITLEAAQQIMKDCQ